MSNTDEKDRYHGLPHESILALNFIFLCLTEISAQISKQERIHETDEIFMRREKIVTCDMDIWLRDKN